jgi:anthranilate/para-aminobenzoate synthase component II
MSLESILMNSYALSKDIPVLGICLGAQFIQTFFEGSLVKLPKTFCKKHIVQCSHASLPFMDSMPDHFKAQFCLNYVIEPNSLAVPLEALCESQINENTYIVGFKHISQPIYGLLYHPEELQNTHKLLDNFVNMAMERKK